MAAAACKGAGGEASVRAKRRPTVAAPKGRVLRRAPSGPVGQKVGV